MLGFLSKRVENAMFAVGHLALGYLTGKATSRLLDMRINVPLLFFASLLPDIDFLLGLEHRGPTHSLVAQVLVFLPVFLVYRKQAAPVFVSLIQHSLLGDLLTGREGVQIFWPITSQWYGTQVRITSTVNVFLEWSAFLVFMGLFWRTGDLRSLFQHHLSNLLLSIPVLTMILPAFLMFPLDVPAALIIPHLILPVVLALSIATDFRYILTKGH